MRCCDNIQTPKNGISTTNLQALEWADANKDGKVTIIDIAAAGSFALLSLAVIIAFNPLDVRRQTQSLVADSLATTTLLSYLHSHDLHYLATSSFSQICDSLLAWNNPSRDIDVTVNGVQCSPIPERRSYSGYAGFMIALPERNVEVDAWVR